MKKIFAVALASFLIFSVVPSVFAGHGGGQCPLKGGMGKCCSGGGHGDKQSQCPIVNALLTQAHTALEHWKDLGLSADQVKTIREIKVEAKKFNIRMNAEMQIAEIDMKMKFKADEFDGESLKKMIDQMAVQMPEGGKKAVDWYASFRSTLKADQWQKLKELL